MDSKWENNIFNLFMWSKFSYWVVAIWLHCQVMGWNGVAYAHMKWWSFAKYNHVNGPKTVKPPLYSIVGVHFTLYNIHYYAYDSDDDDYYYYYYYIIVDLYIALENIFTCLPDVSSFLHILLQRYTIPEQYTCTGSIFSGQFVYFHHHDKPISVSHDMSQTGSVAIWLHMLLPWQNELNYSST